MFAHRNTAPTSGVCVSAAIVYLYLCDCFPYVGLHHTQPCDKQGGLLCAFLLRAVLGTQQANMQ